MESGTELLRRLARADFLYPGIVFIVSLLLYSWTLAPTVTLVDSGELIVAARFLGVAHPPGFPLYIMLAHVASVIPIGQVAQRVNFASAIFAALAASITTLVVLELIKTSSIIAERRKLKKKSSRPNKRLPISLRHSFLTLAPALAVGLVVACSRTLWAYATIAEVYTLNTCLIVTVFWLMLRWRRRIIEEEKWQSPRRSRAILKYDWLLYLAAALFGLALGVHHVTVALMLPALALLVWKTEGSNFFLSKRLLFAALISLSALVAVYSYLPWAAARAPIINWGEPRTVEAIWAHITGKQYQVFLSFDSQIVGKQLAEFGKFLLREFGPWWFPAALGFAGLGFVNLFKHDRGTFWFLSLIVMTDVAYGVSYFIAEDKDAYYLPAFVAVAIAAGFGLRWLLGLVVTKRQSLEPFALATAALVLIMPTAALASNGSFDNRRHYFIAHDYVKNILASVERGGLLLTLDWQVASPMFYTREIEHLRPDVRVVDVNLLRRSWYFDYLNHAYPGLMGQSRDKVNTFVAELRQWDNDPKAYATDARLTQQIASKFQDMIFSFVEKEREIAPVYVTNDLVFQTDPKDRELTEWLTSRYQLVPHGLVFKLEEERGFHEPGELHLETRGLADGTLKFEPDDVVSLKVLPAYETMLINRGRYLDFYNRYQQAAEAFRAALALNPKLDPARQGLDECIAKLSTSQ